MLSSMQDKGSIQQALAAAEAKSFHQHMQAQTQTHKQLQKAAQAAAQARSCVRDVVQ